MTNNSDNEEIAITGVGVTSAIGLGKSAFLQSLLEGRHAFGVLQRAGRQLPVSDDSETDIQASPFLGAEINAISLSARLSKKDLRTSSLSAQVAVTTLDEAWADAGLDDIDPVRIGLVVGGSNFQQRELVNTQNAYRHKSIYLRPHYGHAFMDSDVSGLCSQVFGIRGFAYTLGGASASGQVAVLHALDAVRSGRVDVCIALGALMDLSYWELQAFRSMGAMSSRYSDAPEAASRPFDQQHDGFVFGECCGAVVVEKVKQGRRPGVFPYGVCAGAALVVDGNRSPEPSLDGEVQAIQMALSDAGLTPQQIDYVNPHGTGSLVGDETELRALDQCHLRNASINTTKSIMGHGLSAAGTVEVIATLLQMKESTLHPSRNLDNPIDDGFNWVFAEALPKGIGSALNLSFGFGGINTALCLQNP